MDFKSNKTDAIAVIQVFLNCTTIAKAVKFKEFVCEIITAGQIKLLLILAFVNMLIPHFWGQWLLY